MQPEGLSYITSSSRSPLLLPPPLINEAEGAIDNVQGLSDPASSPHAVTSPLPSLQLSHTMGKERGPPAAPVISMGGEHRELPVFHRSLSESSYISVTALSPAPRSSEGGHHSNNESDSGLDSPCGYSHYSADDTAHDECYSDMDHDKRYISSDRDSANSSPSSHPLSPRFYYTDNNNGMFSITEAYIKRHKQDSLTHHQEFNESEEHMEVTDNSELSNASDDMAGFKPVEATHSLETNSEPAQMKTSSFRQLLTAPGNPAQSLEHFPVASSELHQCRWLQCTAKFVHLDDLVSHVNDAHVRAERDVDYKCYWNDCPRKGKGFNARYKMLIHVRTHTNEKPYKCDLCKKSFSRLENLKIHNRSHTGERPYICPFEGCNKAYSNSSDRFKHVRTHQEQKPYCCRMPGCDKRYTDPSSLRKHVKTHGHYFRQLPANKGGAKVRRTIAPNDDDKKTMEPPAVFVSLSSNPPLSALSPMKQSEVSSSFKEDSKHSSSSSATSRLFTPVVSYPSLGHYISSSSLPTYIPSSSLPPLPATQTTQLPYSGSEDFLHRQAVLCGREENVLKSSSYDHSFLSRLPLSPHHHHSQLPFMTSPGLTLPMGNTLLTLSPNGMPATVPTQVISIHGKMVHISALGNEHPFLDKAKLPSPYDVHPSQTLSAQTGLGSRSSSFHPDPLSLYQKTSEPMHPVSQQSKSSHVTDMPLDLSNPSSSTAKRLTFIDNGPSSDKMPTYINTHLIQNEYRPALAHVQPT